MKRVYLASPFFNDTEVECLEIVEKILEEKGVRGVFTYEKSNG